MTVDDMVAVIDFEVAFEGHPTVKGRAVRETFGFSITRYYQILSRALQDARVEKARPLAVLRLDRRSRSNPRRGVRPAVRAPNQIVLDFSGKER